MEYTVVDHIDIISPVDEDLYELVSGSYILSSDTEPIEDKIYYMLVEDDEVENIGYADADVQIGDDVTGLYEYDSVNDEYFPTADTTAQSGKEYYQQVDQSINNVPDDEASLYYPLEEEVSNPAEEGLYEIVDGSYVLTEDTTYDFEKNYYRRELPPDYELVEEDNYDPLYSIDDVVAEGITEDVSTVALPEDFLFAYTEFVVDPSEEGLYEIVDDTYVLTSDTEVVDGKTYYEYYHYSDYYPADMTDVTSPALSLTNYYEIVDNEYVLTDDDTVAVGKTYYRSHTEDLYQYRTDPSEGATPAEWDDIPYEE